MREKDKKCPPSVKVRLAPLPSRNLNYGNSLNLEECLNRSVAMDRPLSRLSDESVCGSNFSGNSLISVSRSNYEHQSDDLRRNVIEALRMKDTRRRQQRNYLNENPDNYSVDLAFNTKRKRAYEDDDETDTNCIFNRSSGNLIENNRINHHKGTKFARSDRLHIPTKNRFVSSQFKNNEIVSSYFSINQPMISTANQQQQRNFHLNNQLISQDRLTSNKNRTSFFHETIGQSTLPTDPKKSMFQIPAIMISNSSNPKENNINQLSSNLSNSTVSPIDKKTATNETSASSSSSVLFKSLDNTSAMAVEQSTENMSTSSFKEANTDNVTDASDNDENDPNTMTRLKERNHSPIYKIPEHFHSIDEHIHDEKKARSRLGNFLNAILHATSPFLSRSNTTDSQQTSSLKTATDNILTNSKESSKTTTATTSTITFPIVNTKSSDPLTTFKLPTSSNELKLNKTSTPLKVSFDLPGSNDAKTQTSNLNASSPVFKFGEQTNEQQTSKPINTTLTNNNNSTSSTIFKFGASSNDQDKSKTETKSDKPQFAMPTASLTAAKSTLPNFSFGQQETNKPSDSNKTLFTINLPTKSSFNLNPTTTASTSLTSNLSSSLFQFGQNTATTASDKQQQSDSNKSFTFKFGADQTNSTNTIKSTAAPVFNFGQSNSLATSSNLSKPTTTTQQSNSSLFSFGLPSSSNIFGNLETNNTSFNSSSALNNSSTFKAPSTTPFVFSASNSNLQQTASIKPNFSFGAINDKSKENPLLSSMNNSLMGNQTNVGFNFNSMDKNSIQSNKPPASFNFGSNALNSSTNPSQSLAPIFGSTQQSSQNTSTPFKFDANQIKPTFNFGSIGSTNFSAVASSSVPSIPQFNNSFSAPSFNSTSKNMFTMGKK